jgi:glyoxylase-like metal-dependent hydrolase (beta-lactamase superfamily II)
VSAKIFTLEAVAAKHGDCLLLHYGSRNDPRLILIDGGPSGVYTAFLRKRLEQLRQSRGNPLPIDLIMISHIDDDHIRGILDLAGRVEELENEGRDVPYEITDMWFNSFADIVGKPATASVAGIRVRSTGVDVAGEHRHAGAVIASVGQGRALRDSANRLVLTVNEGDTLIEDGWDWDIGDGLTFQIIGPRRQRIDEFQEAWDKEVRKNGWATGTDLASVAAYLDKSPYNLASTVVLAKFGSKSILLTGDARGDDIVEGLRARGLLNGRSFKVNILKVPHHGSDNNVRTDFFRQVKADHYVISGDGKHRNPEIATLRMIIDARGNERYRVHCTYRDGKEGLKGKLTRFLKSLPAAQRRKFVFRPANELSMSVHLRAAVRD